MKAFITGINGFAGSFLAEKLLNSGYNVAGTVQPGTDTENISGISKKPVLYSTDLLDGPALSKNLKEFCPDIIFHLAGASSVRQSTEDATGSFNVNVIGTLNVLEAVKNYLPFCRTVVVTSAEIYGNPVAGKPVFDENSKLDPANNYAASKAAADRLARLYAGSFGLQVIVARPSNHTGPKQSDVFFVPTVAKQLAEIKKGKKEGIIYLGNIDVNRDFTDVRDIVEAYVLLSQKGAAGQAYNICSGKNYKLRDIAEKLIKLSKIEARVKVDPSRIRNTETAAADFDCSKLKSLTGWSPKIDIDSTLTDTLNYWLEKI